MAVIPVIYVIFLALQATQLLAAPLPLEDPLRTPSPSNAMWFVRPPEVQKLLQESSRSSGATLDPSQLGKPKSPPPPLLPPGPESRPPDSDHSKRRAQTPSPSPPRSRSHTFDHSEYRVQTLPPSPSLPNSNSQTPPPNFDPGELKFDPLPPEKVRLQNQEHIVLGGENPNRLDPYSQALRKRFFQYDHVLKKAGRTTFTPDTLLWKTEMLETLKRDSAKSCIRGYLAVKTWLKESIEDQKKNPHAKESTILDKGSTCPEYRKLRKEIEEAEIDLIFRPLQGDAWLTSLKSLSGLYEQLAKTPGWESMSPYDKIRDSLRRRSGYIKKVQKRPLLAKFTEPPGVGSEEYHEYVALAKNLNVDKKSAPGVNGAEHRVLAYERFEAIKKNKFFQGLEPASVEKIAILSKAKVRKLTLEGRHKKKKQKL